MTSGREEKWGRQRMKLLVFSDSHGNLAHMVDAVEREAPDLVLHLGDCWRDGEELGYACPGLPLEQVPGNCDFHPGAAQERLLRLEGHTLFVCHGHTLGVKQGYGGAIRAAQAQGGISCCSATPTGRTAGRQTAFSG